MGLRLLAADERKTLDLGGTLFHVRKIPHGVLVYLNRKNTARGRVDLDGLERDLWVRCLAGWENLSDARGEPIPSEPERPTEWTDPETGDKFTHPLAFVVAMGLPQGVADLLLAEAKGLEAKVHDALGNSSRSSASA